MAADGMQTKALKVDGGMARNNAFLQRMADMSGAEVVRPVNTETTAWGAAFLAGLKAGMFKSLEDGRALWKADRSFQSDYAGDARQAARAGWAKAVASVRSA